MSTLLRRLRRGSLLIVPCFFGALVVAAMMLMPISAAAGGDEALTGKSAGGGSPPAAFQIPPAPTKTVGPGDAGTSPAESPPHLTVSAEALLMTRFGGPKRRLVERVPGSVGFAQVQHTPGALALTSNDLDQGVYVGPRFGLTYHWDSGYAVEVSYFSLSSDTTRAIDAGSSLNWLVMRAPGNFFQTQDFAYQTMQWAFNSNLYNVEFNVRRDMSERITLLAGFRWLQLNEKLQGDLKPMDYTQPSWKFDPTTNLYTVAQLGLSGALNTQILPPFWKTTTRNDLYGIQLGMDAKILQFDSFATNLVIKAGIYNNDSHESTGVSIFKMVQSSQSSANRVAFVGEAALQCKYKITKYFALKAGYQALWLNGVALAAGQIDKTYTSSSDIVSALGINNRSGVVYHGGTAGLEFMF